MRLEPRAEPARRRAAELAPSTAGGSRPTTTTAAAFARVSRRSASASAAATGSTSPGRPSTAAEVTAALTGGVPATHSPATGGSQPVRAAGDSRGRDAAAACGGAIARRQAVGRGGCLWQGRRRRAGLRESEREVRGRHRGRGRVG